MQYDPTCEYSRQYLAISIIAKLEEAGFKYIKVLPQKEQTIVTLERVYERKIENTELVIQVYTTIIESPSLGLTVRKHGSDAIRINVKASLVKKPIITETRINRSGKYSDIVKRMIERARDAYKLSKKGGKCNKCNAYKSRSKSGKWYCSAICWKTPDEKAKDKVEWLSKKRVSRRRYRQW